MVTDEKYNGLAAGMAHFGVTRGLHFVDINDLLFAVYLRTPSVSQGVQH
jgi:hypothetical protein